MLYDIMSEKCIIDIGLDDILVGFHEKNHAFFHYTNLQHFLRVLLYPIPEMLINIIKVELISFPKMSLEAF